MSLPVSQQLIDSIVREVVARLRAPQPAATSTRAPSSGVLNIADRVVTLESLDRRLDGITEVVAPARAIVTPAVRDELRQRGIRLTLADSTNAGSLPEMLFAVSETSFNSAALLKAINIQTSITGKSLDDSIRELTRHMESTARKAVLFTGKPAAAACWANRAKIIRAAVVTSQQDLPEVLEQFDANLIVIDPRKVNPAIIKRIVQSFRQAS